MIGIIDPGLQMGQSLVDYEASIFWKASLGCHVSRSLQFVTRQDLSKMTHVSITTVDFIPPMLLSERESSGRRYRETLQSLKLIFSV